VKMGFLGTTSTLIPWEIVEVRETESRLVVAADKEAVKDGPAFDDDQEITSELEREILGYYGVDRTAATKESGAYSPYYAEASEHRTGIAGPGMIIGDIESGEFREHDPAVEGLAEPEGDLTDEDELRVQRTEEELRAGTREREAGVVNVRKRVRTDRERMEVPTRREEVTVDRVPVDRETSETEIGEDEISVPVTEEEVVVEKRPVAKEEIRIRKDVVEDTEVVEEDVRKEEVDVDDQSGRLKR